MSRKGWQLVGVAATASGAIVALHGITSKRWQTWHTVIVVVATVAAIGSNS